MIPTVSSAFPASTNILIRHEDLVPRERSTCGWRHLLISRQDSNVAAWAHAVNMDGARQHYHRVATELYYVLEGEGTVLLDGVAAPRFEGERWCRFLQEWSTGPMGECECWLWVSRISAMGPFTFPTSKGRPEAEPVPRNDDRHSGWPRWHTLMSESTYCSGVLPEIGRPPPAFRFSVGASSRCRTGAQFDIGDPGRVSALLGDQTVVRSNPTQYRPPKSVAVSIGGRCRPKREWTMLILPSVEMS